MPFLEVRIEDEGVARALAVLEGKARNLRPVLQAAGDGLVANVEERFASQKDPDGNAWRPPSPATLAGWRGFPAKKNPRVLHETTELRGSIHAQVKQDVLFVGTNLVYGPTHQFGRPAFSSLKHKLTFPPIPARPFLGFNNEDERTVRETFEDWLGGLG